jgi:NAD(P)-dependent dehydrogenase (short-subunit alcohol dehydrogenase family)
MFSGGMADMSTPQIALITGANRGIGLETARQLGQKGMHVFLGSRDAGRGKAAAEKLKAQGIAAEAIELDVTNVRTIKAAAEIIANRFGRLDVLVNNAAVALDDKTKPPSGQSLDTWRATFEVNFFGMVQVTQIMLPLLRKSNAGRIVNLASGLASITLHADPKEGLPKEMAIYSVSKTAVNAWTVQLAAELKNTPIKVNACDPGWVKTDMGGPNALDEVDVGARTSIRLATLDGNGPSGEFIKGQQTVPW